MSPTQSLGAGTGICIQILYKEINIALICRRCEGKKWLETHEQKKSPTNQLKIKAILPTGLIKGLRGS